MIEVAVLDQDLGVGKIEVLMENIAEGQSPRSQRFGASGCLRPA